MSGDTTDRIASFHLDDSEIPPPTPEVEQERNIAIFDLLDANVFRLVPGGEPPRGPFAVTLALRGRILSFTVRGEDGERAFALPYAPFRKAARAYFTVCDSYFQAVRSKSPDEIAELEQGRKTLHDEGAAMTTERLAEHAEIDENTARRLFTLIASLYLRR